MMFPCYNIMILDDLILMKILKSACDVPRFILWITTETSKQDMYMSHDMFTDALYARVAWVMVYMFLVDFLE